MEFEHSHRVLAIQLPVDAPEGLYLGFKSGRKHVTYPVHPGDYIVLRGSQLGVMERLDFETKYAQVKQKKQKPQTKAKSGFFSLVGGFSPADTEEEEEEDSDEQDIDEP